MTNILNNNVIADGKVSRVTKLRVQRNIVWKSKN